jgi:transposase, IS5 family
VIDFEVFRGDLEAALSHSDRAKGGHPPYDPVLVFKVLVLADTVHAVGRADRVPVEGPGVVHAVCRARVHDAVPDAKRIWLYREQLARARAAERLFARFDTMLRAKGWLATGGQIIDAAGTGMTGGWGSDAADGDGRGVP